MIQLFAGNREVSGLAVGLALEKHLSMPSAQLRFQVIFEGFTSYLPFADLNCGDPVRLVKDQVEHFTGTIISKRMEGNVMEVIAYDRGRALATNEVKGIFSGTCQQIGSRICSLIGLTPGRMPDIYYGTIVAQGGRTPVDILQELCGNGYYVDYTGHLEIRPVGADHIALNNTTILGISSSQTMEAMVNQALVTNTRNFDIGSATNQYNINKYGHARRYYRNTGPITNANRLAQTKLTGLIHTGQLMLKGDFRLRCGMEMTANYPYFGLVGNYILWNVRHQITGGVHTTHIDLRRED